MSIEKRGNGWYRVHGRNVHGRAKAEAANKTGDEVLALMSHLSSRAEFARRAGLQYKGKRDVYTVAGYVTPGQEKFEDYYGRYERDATAGRIVDMAPKATWKKPPEVVEEGMDPEKGTEFTEAWNTLAKRLKIFSGFSRVDRLSRIGEYGVLLIGVKGEDLKLKDPLPTLSGAEDVIFVSGFHQKSADIQSTVTDTSNPRYGQPELYSLDLSGGQTGTGQTKTTTKELVHWTRIIHIAEDKLENEVFGRPILKRLLNTLNDLEKVTASTGEAYWQLAARILTAELDPEAKIDPEDLLKLGENLEEIVHDLRRQFIGQGAKVDWLASEPPDPKEAADLFMMLAAAGGSIPKRILFGTETGERASEQDERQWLGSVAERQEQFAEPDILLAFIERLIEHKGLPRPKEEINVIWPPLFQESDKTIAESNKARADTAKALTPIGGSPLDLVEIDEDRNVWLVPTAEATGGEEGDEPVDPDDVDPNLGDDDSTTLDEV